MRITSDSTWIGLAALILVWVQATAIAKAKQSSNQSKKQIQWTTSKFIGSPDPALPYVTEQVFADVKIKAPTEMVRVPNTDRWAVLQLNGLLVSFSDSDDPAKRDLHTVIRLQDDCKCWRAYGMVFHPEYPKKPYFYIAYSNEIKTEKGSRLSRFTVTDFEKLTLDPKSEKPLMYWSSIDHAGGSLHFGPDGYLYFPVGDGQKPNPPDPRGTGQDISDIQSSVQRIDVDRDENGLGYRIPPDNPFVKVPGARGEIWAFGIRNIWKMCFHPRTGELWGGDVGWEMKEMVYKVERGANYGWSVMEGSQVVKLNGAHPTVPITQPILEYDHTEGRSITGGYFWQAETNPDLKDTYIYGDFVSGKIWSLKHDGKKLVSNRELVKSNHQVICFALDNDGSVLSVGFDGVIERLVPNPMLDRGGANSQFPKRLSETGLFTSVVDQIPSPGVLPYSINAHHWADHTTSEQWIGLPGDSQISILKRGVYDKGKVKGFFDFPYGTVFAKTVSYQTDMNDPNSKRRLETQVLHRLDLEWKAYNYIWNEEQTDAILQDNVSVSKELVVKDVDAIDGVRKQTWTHDSRDQCLQCHIWRAGTVNGFKVEQLSRVHEDEEIDQLTKLEKMNFVSHKIKRPIPAVSPTDESAPLEARARQYLDLNCSHCHMKGAGGSAVFTLRATEPLEKTELIGTPAMQGDFGIKDALVLSPGHPSKSVLLYRMSKSGAGRMPKFGANVLDESGAKLIHDWIASMPAKTSLENSAAELLDQVIALDDDDFQERIPELLGGIENALVSSIWCCDQPQTNKRRQLIVQAAMERPSEIRDLFEHFLPEEQRIKRLGPGREANSLLTKLKSLKGDAERGRKLFFESSFTCRNCHQVGGKGRMVGPDLSDIGSKRKYEHILKSILQPSAEIEEQYQGMLIVTDDGTIKSGLKGKITDQTIELIDLEGKRESFNIDEIEDSKDLKKSIMPAGLLEEFTAQQAADLMTFLTSLKK